MIIGVSLLDNLSAQAKGNPRLWRSCDLRNSEEDNSQRMLNALGPGTVMPKHRRMKSSESIAIIRGKMIMRLYDNDGIITNELIMAPSGSATEQVAEPVETVEMPMVQIEVWQWHSLEG